MEWISVKERLPKDGQLVIVWQDYMFGHGVNVAKFYTQKQYNLQDRTNNKKPYYWKAPAGPMEWFGQDITYWMETPNPPRKD